MSVDELLDAADDVALQLEFILQAFRRHALPAAAAQHPVGLRGLITADMDVFGREEFHHLGQHLLEKGKSILPPGAEHIVGLVVAVAKEFGMHVEKGLVVAGKFDFGDDFDMTPGRIGDYLPDVVLGKISAIRMPVVVNGSMDIARGGGFEYLGSTRKEIVEIPTVAEGRLRGHLGRAVQLDAPGLIVGQMQMQAAHLNQGHSIQLLDYKVLALEMTHQVEHQPAVCEAREVVDAAESDAAFRVGVAHLDERLQGVEPPQLAGGGHGDSLAVDGEGVCAFRLALLLFGPEFELDGGHVGIGQGKVRMPVQRYASCVLAFSDRAGRHFGDYAIGGAAASDGADQQKQ